MVREVMAVMVESKVGGEEDVVDGSGEIDGGGEDDMICLMTVVWT